jgi:predicted Zn-dependent protease
MARKPGSIFRFAMCVCALLCATASHAAGSRERIERVVNDLKTQLSIAQTVDVAVVAENPKLFSVTPAEHQPGTFLLSVEEDFAQGLNDVELRAAIAHELGHVWIFSHFPYLQTEQLANDIASRVVSRDSLAPLYEKVWKKAAVQ